MKKKNIVLIAILLAITIWSLIKPYDLFTWVLEIAPVLIGTIALLLTYKKFKFSQLIYILMAIHAIVLIIGGKYTYALNPLFEWLKEIFNWERNYYDRLGHFIQGFIPALISREILLRTSPLKPSKWLSFLIVCVCLSVSACYELIEWWIAVAMGETADSFLGSQGDIWDAQWDMFLALIGAITALLTLSKIHDKSIAKHLNIQEQ